MPHPLDDPIRSSLTGAHAWLAHRRGGAVRYPPEVSPFGALPQGRDDSDWADVEALVTPGEAFATAGEAVRPPTGWTLVMQLPGVQMTAGDLRALPGDARDAAGSTTPRLDVEPAGIEPLGVDDVPAMLDLVERTRPGPFGPRTIELGTYLGIRRDGALVAMAGERMHPPGWTEISAVCTDPAWRGRGLAARLVLAVADGIVRRGEVPFLHAAAGNTGAIALYRRLGFEVRRELVFSAVRPPADGVSSSRAVPHG